MLHEFAQVLVDLIFDWGYVGIFVLMSIESSFIPFPSEIVLIPAGYLISTGEMNLFAVFFSGVFGSLLGAYINYFLAYFLGRAFLKRYGKYFFIKEQTLLKMDSYFDKHGHISTFIGRLIPGVRQLISIPAGLSHMSLVKFSIFTAFGAAIWSLVLILLGYYLGENQELINLYLKQITIGVLAFLLILSFVYYHYQKKGKNI
jgi:membrane protein DedA with SNARE-associated domain